MQTCETCRFLEPDNRPDYADVTFAEDHSSQAMTMEPDTWNALNELFVSLPAIFDAIQATEARAQGLVEALEPFEKALGKRQLLCKDDESVTWSAITVGDLRKARQALATWRRT